MADESEDELRTFLLSVLNRIECAFRESEEIGSPEIVNQLESLLIILNNTNVFLSMLTDDFEVESEEQSKKDELERLRKCFLDVFRVTKDHFLKLSLAVNVVTSLYPDDEKVVKPHPGPGRPPVHIPCDVLEGLRELGFTWSKIAQMFGVSRWTIARRVKEYGLENLQGFSDVSDDVLDNIVKDFVARHGRTVGQVYIAGFLKASGFRIQRQRVRECLVRLDPENRVLRWGCAIARRVYSVPWPNSLWHLDGHHSLIRWGLVIHGCIDGFSRRVVFLKCSPNNYARTVLNLFMESIANDGGLWPSRIRVDRGVENVLVCEAMVNRHGEGRGSFVAGPSTRNQRIERLWREVFRCVCYFYYYLFYALEQSGMLDLDNALHMFILHLVFVPRINFSLEEFMTTFNDHKVRTAGNWSPNQMWLNGMMNPNNPLSAGEVDEVPEDISIYGDDPQGPSPFEDSENNVVVEPVNIESADLIRSLALQVMNPLDQSSEMGIDIYTKALQHVEKVLNLVPFSADVNF